MKNEYYKNKNKSQKHTESVVKFLVLCKLQILQMLVSSNLSSKKLSNSANYLIGQKSDSDKAVTFVS